MEKHALFEIGTTNVRLTLANTVEGEHFYIYKVLSEPLYINQNIEKDNGLIKSQKIHEVTTILKMYKKICDAEEVTKFTAIAAHNLTEAKNYKSFTDECGASIGLEFKILTPEQETNAIYTSIINTLDIPKGIIVNVSSYTTRIIHYNRRMILDFAEIPYGSSSLLEKAENMPLIAVDLFKKELAKHAFLQNLDPETILVGASDVFVSFGRIARKMKKYPVEIDQGYATTADSFGKVFDFIKSLDVDRRTKLKGISTHSAATILSGMCIADAVFKHTGLKNLVIAGGGRNIGLLYNAAMPYTLERPVADILGYSLDIIAVNAGTDKEDNKRMYEIALLLFKQLKVLHKLPRVYAKVLRIASHLYSLGKVVNTEHFEKINYHAIMASPIMGASHKEIVLAAFAASFKKWEDFNFAEWVKYKDITTDEELEAVRKIAIILAMAECLNMRDGDIIKDISCDILGDSVILKLVTELDHRAPKIDVKAAEVEIFHAKKFSGEFVKAFKKNVELL